MVGYVEVVEVVGLAEEGLSAGRFAVFVEDFAVLDILERVVLEFLDMSLKLGVGRFESLTLG